MSTKADKWLFDHMDALATHISCTVWLSERQLKVLQLRHDGLTMKQVSAIMGISPSSVCGLEAAAYTALEKANQKEKPGHAVKTWLGLEYYE